MGLDILFGGVDGLPDPAQIRPAIGGSRGSVFCRGQRRGCRRGLRRRLRTPGACGVRVAGVVCAEEGNTLNQNAHRIAVSFRAIGRLYLRLTLASKGFPLACFYGFGGFLLS